MNHYTNLSQTNSSSSLINNPHVHLVGLAALLVVTLWLTVIASKNYSAADMASTKYPKVINFAHTTQGRVLISALWFVSGAAVCKCYCNHIKH